MASNGVRNAVIDHLLIDYNLQRTAAAQVERYGPYTVIYDYFTVNKRTVYDRNIGRRNTVLS